MKSYVMANFTVKTDQQLWEEVTSLLNSVPNGQTKDWKKWRKTWQDLKKKTKAKKVAINRHLNMTGGDPSCSQNLDDMEMKVLGMMNPVQIEGLGGGETPLQFSFDDIDEVLVVDNTIKQVLDQPSKTGEQNDKKDQHNYSLKFPTSHRQKGGAPKKNDKNI
ncbi:unnamed protein product [Psylliodes chrysocephalus]|uniref:Regulatory protein zeste n=1 Tax=Psylliodes chrysocephalus TaxID=3402493 RepID=A0A9P0CRH6_9CUCU|nr:unnamed protein product [Psylliodes chrysocephala]